MHDVTPTPWVAREAGVLIGTGERRSTARANPERGCVPLQSAPVEWKIKIKAGTGGGREEGGSLTGTRGKSEHRLRT